MNDAPAGIGERLRSAREARGLAIEQVAARLRLMNRQVAAMESGDFAALGQPVFARGFVRNYAKLLGLDAEEIAAQMRVEHAPESPPKTEFSPLPAARRWRSAWLLGGLVLLAVIAIPLALYGWLTSGNGPDADKAEEPAAIPDQSGALVPQEKLQAGVPSLPVVPHQATAALSAVPATAASAVPMGSGVSLRFSADARVDIRDAQGRQIVHGLYHSGQEIDLKRGFPLHFVIENAGQVSVSYAGHAIDLRPFTSTNVARFGMTAAGVAAAEKP